MPIYTYECMNGHAFDVLCKYVDSEQRCPQCKEMTVDRKVSAPKGHVKGRGGPYNEFL